MVWGCFAASGPGRIAVVTGTVNSTVYQKILKENVWPSVCDLKLTGKWSKTHQQVFLWIAEGKQNEDFWVADSWMKSWPESY